MDTRPLADPDRQLNSVQETESSATQGLSKKAQKRAVKAARLREHKLERRAREKEVKKRKRRERAQAIAKGQPDADSSCKRPRTTDGSGMEIFNARVVIDLGFDELMSDKEINSLTSQLAYTYSANRHAAHAFSALIFTSLNGRTKQRLDAINDAGYKRWLRTEWWEEGYDRLWTGSSLAPTSLGGETDMQGSITLSQANLKDIVYLTADSSQELLELNEGEIYIIGGICDHNRYKNLCLNKAIGSHIRHARLPIGRYISLTTRKVLTVNQVRLLVHRHDRLYRFLVQVRNADEILLYHPPSRYTDVVLLVSYLMCRSSYKQVFEILLKWIETRNWEEAFWAVIPQRKLQGGRGDQGREDDNNSHYSCTEGRECISDVEQRASATDVLEKERGPGLLGGR